MDGTATAEVFEHAARYEPDLTDRQREVLRLIAAEKTNAEIADTLGMTLAGAKWHVSELLTKLGLDSREAAAEYYRWRGAPRRRLGRSLRGILSAPVLKLSAAGAAGIGAVAVATAVFIAMNGGDDVDPGPAVPGLPFYMEAVWTSSQQGVTAPQVNRRYWYQDASHTRTESDPSRLIKNEGEASFPAATAHVVVRDGTFMWRSEGADLYSRQALAEVTSPTRSLDMTELGPIKAASLDAFIAARRTGWELLSRGPAKMLGEEVELIELKTLDANGKPAHLQRYWADARRLLILGSETRIWTRGTEVVGSELVTRLVYGDAQPAERFAWVPQPGTREDTCRMPQAMLTAAGTAPSPFLAVPIAAAPPPMSVRSFGASRAADGTCDVGRVEFALSAGPTSHPSTFVIRQEAHNLDSVFSSASSEPVDIGGIEARLGDADDGGRSVAWRTADVGVEIRSTVLTDEELIAFAKAMVEANP